MYPHSGIVVASLLAFSSACSVEPQPGESEPAEEISNCSHRALFVMAHQDDDILFAYSGLAWLIRQGYCVRTVYTTAGDASQGLNYALSRNAGARNAYAGIAGFPRSDASWGFDVRYYNAHPVAYAQLGQNISHVYLEAQDGFALGQREHGSLEKLWWGASQLPRVDGWASYTNLADFEQVLAEIIVEYQPDAIHTLDGSAWVNDWGPYPVPGFSATRFGWDHSDHIFTARVVYDTLHRYGLAIPFDMFRGYNTGNEGINLDSATIAEKYRAFYEWYVPFDQFVPYDHGYSNIWLAREYYATF